MKKKPNIKSPLFNKEVVLAKGVLDWQRCERVCDRYGAVHLGEQTENIPAELEGKFGVLSVKVIEGRKSCHLGDMFRGFHQTAIQKAGTVLILGEGYLFEEDGEDGVPQIGVKPKDGRKDSWLNGPNLYNVHQSLVELIFTCHE